MLIKIWNVYVIEKLKSMCDVKWDDNYRKLRNHDEDWICVNSAFADEFQVLLKILFRYVIYVFIIK